MAKSRKSKPRSDAAPPPSPPEAPAPPVSGDVVHDDPPRCFKCESTNLRVIRKLRTQAVRGTHRGKPYTSISRRRAACDDCGQHQFIVTREFDPKVWEAPAPCA